MPNGLAVTSLKLDQILEILLNKKDSDWENKNSHRDLDQNYSVFRTTINLPEGKRRVELKKWPSLKLQIYGWGDGSDIRFGEENKAEYEKVAKLYENIVLRGDNIVLVS